MGKVKGSGKTCQECFEQLSVTKSCYCCIDFPAKKNTNKKCAQDVKIRRTERVKRGKPDYFDILEYERQAKKEKKQRSKPKLDINKQELHLQNNKYCEMNDEYKSNRMHLKTKKNKKKKIDVKPPPKEEDLEEIVLSKETTEKFNLILQDINKKIYASSWRGYT